MKYDYSKVSREALEELAKADDEFASADTVVARHLAELSDARDAVRAQAQVKTRAEYDREIGDWLRTTPWIDPKYTGTLLIGEDDGSAIRALVNASRNAPEE